MDRVYEYVSTLIDTELEGEASITWAERSGERSIEIKVLHSGQFNRLYQRLKTELREFGFSWDLSWCPMPGSGIWGAGCMALHNPTNPNGVIRPKGFPDGDYM